MKLITKFLFAIFSAHLLFTGTNQAFALEVVYPKTQNTTINAKSTFFIGNIGKDTTFLINETPIKTYRGGAFVHVVPLNFGLNTFTLKSLSSNGTSSSLNYKITRPAPPPATTSQTSNVKPLNIEEFNVFFSAVIAKNNSPLRNGASDNAIRVSHLDKGAKLVLDAKKGDYYRVYINENTNFWVKSGYIKDLVEISPPLATPLKHFNYEYDNNYEYFKFKTGMSVPFTLTEVPEGVEVTLYYVSSIPQRLEKYAENIKLENNKLSFLVRQNKLWGYDCYFDTDSMVFRLTREVKIDTHSPLKDLVIAIDPGHGGYDGGAIGPTKVREADIVLDIAQKLEQILLEQGAQPILTRTGNEFVDLYKRVEIIKAANPVFSISIHANALPDGADPYIKHGTSVYYYHPQAKELAQTIKDSIIQSLCTRDDGTLYSSFVLTRITSPLAILVETAYMINPSDYEKLTEETMRQAIAQSIADGLKAYLQSTIPK